MTEPQSLWVSFWWEVIEHRCSSYVRNGFLPLPRPLTWHRTWRSGSAWLPTSCSKVHRCPRTVAVCPWTAVIVGVCATDDGLIATSERRFREVTVLVYVTNFLKNMKPVFFPLNCLISWREVAPDDRFCRTQTELSRLTSAAAFARGAM